MMAAQAAGLTLGQWVATIRGIAADDQPNVTLVAGNEASDADSIVTAQVYGYLKQQMAAEGDGPVVPVVMCNREDVTLRKETTLLLENCGVDYNHFVYLDDPGTDKLLSRVKTVTLVDHNKAMGMLEAHGDKVVEILDHHKDLGAHPNAAGAARNIAFEGEAATVASACSVIAEVYLASALGRELLARDNGAAARALLGVILIDAVNLDPAAKRVCPRDAAAAAEMMSLAPSPTQEELYHSLVAAKFDAGFWSGLTIQQCLRYDYKEFTTNGKTYGLSSCLCPLDVLAGKDSWEAEVTTRAGKLDLFGVLTQVKPADGGPVARQLMLYVSDAAVGAQAAAFAQAYESPCLELEPIQLVGLAGAQAFSQKNVGASRKQVQPCIGAFFSTPA